jgi:hypothetical protein
MKVQISILHNGLIEVYQTEINESFNNYLSKVEYNFNNKESLPIKTNDRFIIIGNDVLQNSIIEFKEIKD